MYIILPTHNRPEKLRTVLNCLKQQTYQNYIIIIVNTGNEIKNELLSLVDRFKIVKISGSHDWWWARSLQEGIDWLQKNKVNGDEIVLFLNDDVTFEDGFLQKAIEFFKRNKNTPIQLIAKVSCDGGRTIEETGIKYNPWLFKFRTVKVGEDPNCLPTRGLFIRLKDIRKIGRFRPFILPHYLSDYEYTYRGIVKKGVKGVATNNIFLCPDYSTTGYHVVRSGSIGKYIKTYLSKKSAKNPVYASVFIVLTAPKIVVLPLILVLWSKFLIRVICVAVNAAWKKNEI